jgi:type VI secretion system secreted protein VgrG
MALPGMGAHQVLKLKTKLGDGKLLVLNMEGREYLGRLPEYRIETVGNVSMLGDNEDIDLKKVLGTSATLTLEVPGDENKRYFHSYVVRMQRGERKGRHERFSLVMRPWLYFLTRTKTSRIFQAQSVKEIIELVLSDYDVNNHDFRLAGTYPKLDYCVQYDETDFDFVSRLLEEAGISYFFEHEEEKHTMVMCDDMGKHKRKPVEKSITWANALTTDSTVMDWHSQQELRSVQTVVRDHDYLASATKIEATEPAKEPLSNKVGKMEVFEYPVDVVQNQLKPDAQSAADAAKQRAKVTMERLVSLQAVSTGRTNARDVSVGTTFDMEEEEGLLGAAVGALFGGGTDKQRKGTYLTIGANYRMEFAQHEAIPEIASMQGRREGFVCEIVAISVKGTYFRPERGTPRPVIHGPQPALVVGASGETSDKKEIDVDKHGRVKVKFYWDRETKVDKALTCWVRVMQPAAGPGYGMWVVPRIGHEVLVSFLEGNPDRPVITGSVYNDKAMVAYELPKQATVSGWRTHSSEKGAADTANELRFDDAKDKEYLWLQAQNEYRRFVKKNVFDMVGENETLKVKLTRKEVVGENWYLDVGKDVMHNLGKDLHTKVAGDVFLTGGATYQLKVAKEISVQAGGDVGLDVDGKLQIKASGDLVAQAAAVKVKSDGEVTIEATSKITLKCGGSTIVLDATGVSIVGTMVKINSGGGGGSAGSASPKEPAEAKILDELTAAKASDYDKLFEDPIVTAGGKVGSATA